ncbi:MAG: carbohydrate kinase family protein [Acidobacteriaceae bacterium]
MNELSLKSDPLTGFIQVVGIGGIGTGTIIALRGNHTLGRNESRMGEVIEARDYCKLHIAEHYIATLMGSKNAPEKFSVVAVGNVGNDAAGAALIREMGDAGIDTRHVRIEPDSRTMFSFALLYPDKSGGNITVSNSAACKLSSDQLSKCRDELAAVGSKGVALCLPEVPLEPRAEFLRIATGCGSYRIASFTSDEMAMARKLGLLGNVDMLALNREEAIAFAGAPGDTGSETGLLDKCCKVAAATHPTMRILVSAGADGAYVLENGTWSHHDTVPVEPVSTAGAGDALLAGAISGLAAGLPLRGSKPAAKGGTKTIDSAIDLGLALAAFSVTSTHTIHPAATLATLLSFAREHGIDSGKLEISIRRAK